MMTNDEPVKVLNGVCKQGYRWQVDASGIDADFMTMMLMFDADGRQLHGGGMGGPKLYPGSVINEYRGRNDDWPYVVVARTAPRVDRVVATTDQGTELELQLSEVIDSFALRFAAAVLPMGHGPASISAEAGGNFWKAPASGCPDAQLVGLAGFGRSFE